MNTSYLGGLSWNTTEIGLLNGFSGASFCGMFLIFGLGFLCSTNCNALCSCFACGLNARLPCIPNACVLRFAGPFLIVFQIFMYDRLVKSIGLVSVFQRCLLSQVKTFRNRGQRYNCTIDSILIFFSPSFAHRLSSYLPLP